MSQSLTLLPIEELKTLLSEVVRAELSNLLPAPAEPFHDYPELMTRRQTAELLGVSLATLDLWTNERRLAKHRLGAAVRFRKSEVLASLQTLEKFKRFTPSTSVK